MVSYMVNLQDPTVLSEFIGLVDKIAVGTCRDYPGLDPEDIRQSLLLFVYENQGSLKGKEDGGNPRLILNKVCKMLCNKERAEQLSATVQYHYRPSDVRQILESYLGSGDPIKTFVPEDAVSESGNDAVECASDLMYALSVVDEKTKKSLTDRYIKGIIPLNASYERKALNKAVIYLTKIMNQTRGKVHDGKTGQRKVVSNSRAQALIHQEW
jgi:hypothetical protein